MKRMICHAKIYWISICCCQTFLIHIYFTRKSPHKSKTAFLILQKYLLCFQRLHMLLWKALLLLFQGFESARLVSLWWQQCKMCGRLARSTRSMHKRPFLACSPLLRKVSPLYHLLWLLIPFRLETEEELYKAESFLFLNDFISDHSFRQLREIALKID